MRRTFIALAIVAVFSLIISCSQPVAEFMTPERFEESNALLDKYDIAGATKGFEALSQDATLSAWGYYGLGQTELTLMNYFDAARFYYRALEVDPNFAPAYLGLGRIASRLQWPSEGVEMLKKAVELGGDYDHARHELALEQLKLYQFAEGIKTSKGLDGDGVFSKWIEAIAAWNNLEITPASQDVTQALIKCETPLDLMAASIFLREVGLLDSAAIMNNRMIEASAWSAQAIGEYFRQAVAEGDFQSARRAISRIPENEGTKSLIARMYIDYHLARKEGVEAFLNNRTYQEADSLLFDAPLTNFIVKTWLADAFTGEQMLSEVEMKLDREKLPAGLKRFVTLYTLSLPPEIRAGKQAWSRISAQKQVGIEDYPYDLLDLYLALSAGAFDQYDSLQEEYFDVWGDGAAATTMLADITARDAAEAASRAFELYPAVLEKHENFVPAFRNWVNLLMRKRYFDEAVVAFEKYPQFAKNSKSLAADYAICLAETNKGDSAWVVFEPALREMSVAPRVVDSFLKALWKFDRADLAVQVCEQYAALVPDNPEALALVAEWLNEFKQYDRAFQLAGNAEGMEFATSSAAIQKARALYLLGEKDKATDLFVELMDKTEGDPELDLYYSELLAMDDKNPRQTGNMARSAMVNSRHMIRAYMNMGYVYAQQQRPDLAVGQARQAIRMFPDHPRLYYMLGKMSYLDKRSEYKTALQEAIKLGLNGTELEDARKLLGQ